MRSLVIDTDLNPNLPTMNDSNHYCSAEMCCFNPLARTLQLLLALDTFSGVYGLIHAKHGPQDVCRKKLFSPLATNASLSYRSHLLLPATDSTPPCGWCTTVSSRSGSSRCQACPLHWRPTRGLPRSPGHKPICASPGL